MPFAEETLRKIGYFGLINGYKIDLFAVVIAFSYLLPDGDFSKFIRKLKKITSHYLRHSTAITESELHRLMGFPPNWNSIINAK